MRDQRGKLPIRCLILTPTRELCIQVTQALRAYATRKGADVVAVFGGAPIRTQQAQLKAGGHIVVGTVGWVYTVAAVVATLTIAFLTLFMLLEGPEWRRRIMELVAERHQPTVRRIGGVMMGAVPATNLVYNAAANASIAVTFEARAG